jgi:uncharacterized membrane protein YkoI
MGKPNDPQGITEDRKMNPEIKQFVDAEEKRMYSDESRTEMADAGAAMPDGSYPIKDEADLRNAIQAFGRAKDPEATKAHIKKRAVALDLEDLIPDNWNDGKSVEDVEEKAVVRVSAMGEVKACAKGDVAGCGYKKGDKVCGKCGAMAVMTKGAGDADVGVGMEREMDEEVPDEDQALVRSSKKPKKPMTDVTDESTEAEIVRQAARKKMRTDRMNKIGVKDASDDHFMCAFDRKVLAPESPACEGCKGGCFAVKGGVDILEVEAIAEQQYDAEVVDSGYSDIFDRFVVDLRKKDGELIEAFYDGSGKDRGWQPIEEDAIAFADDAISPDEAIDIAEGFIEGKSLTITVSSYEGGMSYCVELEGKDGYSYDVFVDPIEGKVLGADQWEYSTTSVEPGMQKDDALMASLMEFEALTAEEELREKGLI